jgi:fused signal recognition particle receptor
MCILIWVYTLRLLRQSMIFSWIKSGWASVQKALSSTRKSLQNKLRMLFGRKIDEQLLEDIEEILFEADLGSSSIKEIMQSVKKHLKEQPDASLETLLKVLEESLFSEISGLSHSWVFSDHKPTVIVVIGANGSGKTTSIAKLAHAFASSGKSVLLAAADTFRAAALEQLDVWAQRLNINVVKGNYNADPASVAYDAIAASIARSNDILLIDTAGRLENRQNLLRELEKIQRSCQKALPGSPHEVLLVIDATIGQNGIEQARAFHQAMGITGLILTKLDGSAKGGIVIAIQKQLGIPVKFIGIGESLDSLIPFEPKAFVHSLLFDDELS